MMIMISKSSETSTMQPFVLTSDFTQPILQLLMEIIKKHLKNKRRLPGCSPPLMANTMIDWKQVSQRVETVSII